MFGQKRKPAMVQAQPFPDAIAQHERAIEHRYLGLIARHQLAIDIDQPGRVAQIVERIVGATSREIKSSGLNFQEPSSSSGAWTSLYDEDTSSGRPGRDNGGNDANDNRQLGPMRLQVRRSLAARIMPALTSL